MSTCSQLHLQTLESQPLMPKNLPNHWSHPQEEEEGNWLHVKESKSEKVKFGCILINMDIFLEF
jgi:hypothetical protein